MGLFSRKQRTPVVHPPTPRRIVVAAPIDAVAGQVAAYGELQSPRHATSHRLGFGSVGDTTLVHLPDRLHPWAFHNLAFWLLDTPGAEGDVRATADPGPQGPGYTLVPDPELADCLCGVDGDGRGMTVLVPTNDLVLGGAVPATGVPAPEAVTPATTVTVLLEDPQHDLNPGNEATRRRRRDLRSSFDITML